MAYAVGPAGGYDLADRVEEWVIGTKVQYFSVGQQKWYDGSVLAIDSSGNIDVYVDEAAGKKIVPADEVARRLKHPEDGRPDDDRWTCLTCDQLNDPDREQCQHCGASKPKMREWASGQPAEYWSDTQSAWFRCTVARIEPAGDVIVTLATGGTEKTVPKMKLATKIRKSKVPLAATHYSMGLPSAPASAEKLTKQREEFLSTIKDPHDKELQQLLWDSGFAFDLKPHQFAGVRFVAGVPKDFPTPGDWSHFLGKDGPCKGGGILADEMGLGKTVEALGGAKLRRIIAKRNGDVDDKQRCTLIVTPNWPVASQWTEHAVTAGYTRDVDIVNYEGRNHYKKDAFPKIVITTIHVLMAEMRAVFQSIHKDKGDGTLQHVPSPLAPQLTAWCAACMHAKYHGAKGTKPDHIWVRGKEAGDNVNDIMKKDASSYKLSPTKVCPWLTVVIDEAHFLRNPSTMWSLMAVALGQHSRRMILASGTPYNNRLADLATLHAFIEPRDEQAGTAWWKALEPSKDVLVPVEMVDAVRQWKLDHMLRRTREGVLSEDVLPKKADRLVIDITPSESEMKNGYLETEEALLKIQIRLAQLMKGAAPDAPRERFARDKQLKQIKEVMLGLMQKCRMYMLHPVMGCAGRELTHKFAPSRRDHPLKTPKVCVKCNPALTMAAAALKAPSVGERADSDSENDDEEERGDEVMAAGGTAVGEKASAIAQSKCETGPLGPLVQIPRECCGVADCHWVHKVCLEELHADGRNDCPRCSLCREMLHKGVEPEATLRSAKSGMFLARQFPVLGTGQLLANSKEPEGFFYVADAKDATYSIKGIAREGNCLVAGPGERLSSVDFVTEEADGKIYLKTKIDGKYVVETTDAGVSLDATKGDKFEVAFQPTNTICKDVAKDFNGNSYEGICMSSKMVELRRIIQEDIPKDDKVIIFSFFKGFLDLAEAMLTHEMQVVCERFDGDVSREKKAASLDHFQKDEKVRVLLATIQSGGVGLNIVQANWVIFADRWFNPQVHAQSFARVWRLLQKKQCHDVYIDADGTFDKVVTKTFETKEENAHKVLTIGDTELGPIVDPTLHHLDPSSLLADLGELIAQREKEMRKTTWKVGQIAEYWSEGEGKWILDCKVTKIEEDGGVTLTVGGLERTVPKDQHVFLLRRPVDVDSGVGVKRTVDGAAKATAD